MLLPALFHWSPADRRASIRATGLQPGSPNTVSTSCLEYVCLGTSPARAWTISGAMNWVAATLEALGLVPEGPDECAALDSEVTR